MVVDSPPGMTRRVDRRRARRGVRTSTGAAPSVVEARAACTGERALQRQHADLAGGPRTRWAPRGRRVRAAYQPRSASLVSSPPISRPGIAVAEAAATPWRGCAGRRSGWWPRRWPWPGAAGSSLLKMPEPTNTASAPSCITSAASAGVAMPPAQNSGTGSVPVSATSCTRPIGRLQPLGPVVELGRVGLGDLADVAEDRAQVADRLDDVAGAGLALRADHAAPSEMRRSASPRLVAPHTNGTVKRPLVDVVGLVGRGEHLGLVDVVDAERLEDLRLDEVPDAGLGHDRDGDGGLDALDHLGVAHAGHAAVAADVGRAPARAP